MKKFKARKFANEIICLFLFCASTCYAGVFTTNIVDGITTITFDDVQKDGWSWGVYKTIYRRNTKIMQESYAWTRNGDLILRLRSYFIGDDLVMRERDENGNETNKLISVYHAGSTNVEMFYRFSDGSVKPVAREEFETVQQMAKVFDDKWSPTNITIINTTNVIDLPKDKLPKIIPKTSSFQGF